MIQLSSVTKSFGARTLLDDVTWQVADRDIVGLCGPNGAGKTTLLRIFANLDEPDAGTVVNLRVELPDGLLEAKARVAGASVDGASLPGPALQFLAGLEFLALAAADQVRLRSFLDTEAKRRRGAHTPPR